MARANPDPARTDDNHTTAGDALHAIALAEKQLRESDVVIEPNVRISATGARISFDTGAFNESSRGRVTAKICTAVANAADWELVTVHDPLERDDSHLVQSMFTLRATDGRSA